MIEKYPKILLNKPNSFAQFTFTKRFPKVLNDVIASNLFSNEVMMQLKKLNQDLSTLSITRLKHPSQETYLWNEFYNLYLNNTLSELPFFEAEVYFYALINQLVNYEEFKQDPFAQVKRNELTNQRDYFKHILEQVAQHKLNLENVIFLSLSGNKADLSQLYQSKNNKLTLLINHIKPLTQQLKKCNSMSVILDNAGTELFTDLIFAHFLIENSLMDQVHLHFKLKPIFVSDALVSDLYSLLDFIEQIGDQKFSLSIKNFIGNGKMVLHEHIFWNAPLPYHQFPVELAGQINKQELLISKGDANYRRFFGDRKIPSHITPNVLVDYLDINTFALRTLKSEIQLGLTTEQLMNLRQSDPEWMVNGNYAVIQSLN